MGQISYFFLKTLRQNPTDWLYHVFSLGHMRSSSKEEVLWLSTPYFYAAHTQVMHYWHSQRTTSSVKGLEQLFLSIATTPLCCQHCRRQVQTIFPRESAVLDPKSSCRHRCSGKKSPWPSEAVLILQFPSPAATCCNSSKIPAQRMPRKIHPMVVFPKCWLQG